MARAVHEIKKELDKNNTKYYNAKRSGNRTLTAELEKKQFNLTLELRNAQKKEYYEKVDYIDWGDDYY